MFATLRRGIYLLDPTKRGRWIGLIVLAIGVSLMEAVAAILIFGLLGMITGGSQAVTLPIVGDLRGAFSNLSQTDFLIWFSSFTALFFLLRGIAYVAQSYLQNRVAVNAGVLTSTRLVRHYLSMPYARHLQRDSADLMRNIVGSSNEFVTSGLIPFLTLTSESLLAVGLLTVLLISSPIATLAALGLAAPLVLTLVKMIQPKMERMGVENQERVAAEIRALQQSFQGIRDIKVLRREKYFGDRFFLNRAQIAKLAYTRAVLIDAPRVIIETTLILFVLGFLILLLANDGQVADILPILGLMAYAVLRVLPSLNRILSSSNTLRFGKAAIDLLYEDFRDLEDFGSKSSGDPRTIAFGTDITINDVSFRYDNTDTDVLKHVTLRIRAGEMVGFVGETGSGKSTLIDVIMGLLTPTSGQVLVDGTDIQDNLHGWWSNIGIVSQTLFLLDDTITRNIALGLDDDTIDEAKMKEAVEIAQLDRFASSLQHGLNTKVGEQGVRLSGGQRQRIAIARALYQDPHVLVLDEGTSALDTVTENELIRALHATRGTRTIIMVAHRISTIRNCDRICLLRNGSVEAEGTFDELRTRSDAFRQMAE